MNNQSQSGAREGGRGEGGGGVPLRQSQHKSHIINIYRSLDGWMDGSLDGWIDR